jgi:copper chaperone CopZ
MEFLMKYIILLAITLSSFSFSKENTTYLKVNGMQCSYSCAEKVSKVVQKIDGVKECSVDFAGGVATVVYDDQKLESKDIITTVQVSTSYTASEMCDKSKATYIGGSGQCDPSKKKSKTQEI